jgi:serine/threonine protein phosphatase PrpC
MSYEESLVEGTCLVATNDSRYSICREDINTQSTLVAVFEGHGGGGNRIADFFKRNFSEELFGHPGFASNISIAISESLARLERNVVDNPDIETDYSGATCVRCVIRGSDLT